MRAKNVEILYSRFRPRNFLSEKPWIVLETYPESDAVLTCAICIAALLALSYYMTHLTLFGSFRKLIMLKKARLSETKNQIKAFVVHEADNVRMNTPTISGGDNFITALSKIGKKLGSNQLGRKDSLTDARVNDDRTKSPSKRSFRRMNDSDDESSAALPDLRKGSKNEWIRKQFWII